MTKPVTFLASFPAIQTAIKVTGNGDGMRVQLDIPESEMGNAIGLIEWREMVLRVTVEPRDCKAAENNAIPEGAKRKSKWTPAEG